MTAEALSISPVTRSDEDEWRALWTGYLTFYETAVEEMVYRTTFERLLSGDAHEYAGLLARTGSGEAVGLAHFLEHRHCWRVENVIYLQDLFVARTARGTGAGRALIEAVYAEADKRGAGSVYWTTQEFNETARALYDRIGVLTPFIKYQRP